MLQAVGRGRCGPRRSAGWAIEGDSMTVGLRDQIAEKLPKLEIVATSGLVEQLRLIKDKEEIARIRKAVWQAEKAFAVLRSTLRPEMTEKEVADELEHQFRLFGAKDAAFPSIVAVGPRAALPHATPTRQRIGEDDFVLVDWGANEGLYKSDLTRVLVTGKISPKLRAGVWSCVGGPGPGDRGHPAGRRRRTTWTHVARSVIAKAGFGRRFRPRAGARLGPVNPRSAAVGRQEPDHAASREWS